MVVDDATIRTQDRTTQSAENTKEQSENVHHVKMSVQTVTMIIRKNGSWGRILATGNVQNVVMFVDRVRNANVLKIINR